MQRELPIIDFASEADVRSRAESRRTEEVAGLLKAFFAWWMPRPRRWTLSLRQSGRPILEAVQPAHRPTAAGRS
jgi:hypothetical protein